MSGFEQLVEFNYSFQRIRSVPEAKPLVGIGDKVNSGSPILQIEEKGELLEVAVSKYYNLTSKQFLRGLRVNPGDRVIPGSELFVHKGFLGVGAIELRSPVSGTIVSISESNQSLTIEVESRNVTLPAFYSGVVSSVKGSSVEIQGIGNLCQGVFGFGGEVYGTVKNLALYDSVLRVEDLDPQWQGYILVGVKTVEAGVLSKLVELGIRGIVIAHCKPAFLGELGVEVSSNVSVDLKGFGLMMTERFSDSPFQERVKRFFEETDGCFASMRAYTQIRAGSIRPELWVWCNKGQLTKPKQAYRVVTDPYWNKIFTDLTVLKDPYTFQSGITCESVVLKNNGECLTVPATAVEPVKVFE